MSSTWGQSTDKYEDLPDDPEEAFVQVEKGYREESERAMIGLR